jgi:hypothetical protein
LLESGFLDTSLFLFHFKESIQSTPAARPSVLVGRACEDPKDGDPNH